MNHYICSCGRATTQQDLTCPSCGMFVCQECEDTHECKPVVLIGADERWARLKKRLLYLKGDSVLALSVDAILDIIKELEREVEG
jgi:hypothetical protein